MTELWKLPKAERNSIESTVAQLRKALMELQTDLQRTKNRLHEQEWLVSQKECQLTALCNRYGILKKSS